MTVIHNTWNPEPTKTESNMPRFGGLNTSPWTNFQPNSSLISSPASI